MTQEYLLQARKLGGQRRYRAPFHIDEYKTSPDFQVKLMETPVFGGEILCVLHNRRAPERSIKVVYPVMVAAPEQGTITPFMSDGEIPVDADIGQRMQFIIPVAYYQYRLLTKIDGEIIAGGTDFAYMTNGKPGGLENPLFFQFEYQWVVVEAGRYGRCRIIFQQASVNFLRTEAVRYLPGAVCDGRH